MNKIIEEIDEVYSPDKEIAIRNKNAENLFYGKDNDKIKILELSNIIDKWEQEVLFGHNGFYSLKGKDVKNKVPDFIAELEDFIDVNLNQIFFTDKSFKETAYLIKKEKVSSLKKTMLIYAQEELRNWEFQVYKDGINNSVNRAVLYKDDDTIVQSSYKNGISIIYMMSEKEMWNSNLLSKKIKDYNSQFYNALISAFIKDKNINCFVLFEKYGDIINVEDREKLKSAIENLKNNIIAYNWSKELFSYNLSKEEQYKKLETITDKNIKENAKLYLDSFSALKNFNDEKIKKEKNNNNWDEIINILQTEPEKAFLYIDYSLNEDSVKNKKSYIKQIKKCGYIKTNKDKFISLLNEFFENFETFKQKDISNYLECLSDDDYKFFIDLQKMNYSDFEYIVSDYKYLKLKFEQMKLTQPDDKYEIIRLVFLEEKNMVSKHKLNLGLDERNKIIDSVLNRFNNKK